MELRRYWQIIMRYWILVALLTVVGLAAAYQYYITNRPTYQAVAVISIVQSPSPNDTFSNYYANTSSEFAADEFPKILSGNVFMSEVANQLKEGNINVSADELKGMVTTESKHRILTITVGNKDQNTALQTAKTIALVLKDRASEFVQPRQVMANLVDMPTEASLSGGRTLLLAAVRVLAGLIAGIGLAFLLAYLDTAIHTRAEAEETLGLPVLGIIPGTAKGGNRRATSVPPGDEDQLAKARLLSLQTEQDREQASTR